MRQISPRKAQPCLNSRSERPQVRARKSAHRNRNRRVRSGDGRAVVLGRRGAVQAGHDLGRTGRHRADRRGDAGQIGRQRADAHHRTARAHCSLAVVMIRSRCVLRGGLGGCSRMFVRNIAMARSHMVMRRSEVSETLVANAGRSAAPGKACRRCEHAEQIGEGDDPPHPDPHRSRQSQQHSAGMLSARQRCTRGLQNSSKLRGRQAPSYRSAPRMPNIAPQCLTLWRAAGHGPARARAKSSRTDASIIQP